MRDFWAVSGGIFLTVTSYYNKQGIPWGLIQAHFSLALPYMKSPLSELVLLQFYWEL